ncbi:MAG TPA: hypothetical protein VHA75_02600 [Rugosimonospora sp.]|nr:hypothetical protein [Rugosimonospora sp.]
MTTAEMPMPALPPELIDAQWLPLLGFIANGWIAGVKRGRAEQMAEVNRVRELARAAVSEAPTWGPAMRALADAVNYEED